MKNIKAPRARENFILEKKIENPVLENSGMDNINQSFKCK